MTWKREEKIRHDLKVIHLEVDEMKPRGRQFQAVSRQK